MSQSAWITLLITVVAAALLISEKLRPDLVALLVLAVLGLTRIVTPTETFAGFSGSVVMTIIGISIISEGLRQTGVTRSIGRLMYRLSAGSAVKLILVTTLFAATLSLVMNNIAAVGVLLPATLTLARRGKISPSKLMLPLAYGVSLGGMATLLTTANLIVSGSLKDAGYKPFGLLDFMPIGGPIVIAGAIYMVFIGQKLMPDRASPGIRPPQEVHAALSHLYGLDGSFYEIEVLADSPLVGRSIREGEWEQVVGVRILRISRDAQTILSPRPDEIIQADDHLVVQSLSGFDKIDHLKLRIMPEKRTSDDVTDAGTTLIELIITPHGGLAGHTLQQVDFRYNYHLHVLGIWREGKPVTNSLATIKLRAGDALLVQGTAEQLTHLDNNHDLIVLEDDPEVVPNQQKYTYALLISLTSLVIAAIELVPLSVVVFCGAVLLLLTGCIRMDDVYKGIEWKAIFLIAGMWPLSTALRTSGLADQAITTLLGFVGTGSLLVISLVFILVALVLTQITGGQVAALILAPLAIATAARLGNAPYTLAMAAALGCSLSFPTPFGHPVNIMVMTPGGYTFQDYVRVGAPLTILVIILILLGLNRFMPM